MIKLNKFLIIFLFLNLGLLFSQSSDTYVTPADFFTTRSVMLKEIYYTNLGYVVRYYSDDLLKEAYIPNSFFIDGRAKQIVDNEYGVAPQMNIVYKNNKPFIVKIYLPSNTNFNPAYKVMEVIPQYIQDAFADQDTKKELRFPF